GYNWFPTVPLYRYVVLLAVGNVSVFHCLRIHLQRPRVLCSGHADQRGARIVSLRATFERRPAAGVTVYTLLRTGRARGLNASFQGSFPSLPFENSLCIFAVDALQRGGRQLQAVVPPPYAAGYE